MPQASLDQRPDEWQKKTIKPAFLGGFVPGLPSTEIKDNESPSLLNVAHILGTLKGDTGYGNVGQTSLAGHPQGAFQFFLNSGSNFLCLITTSSFYVLNVVLNQWQLVDDGTSTTSTGLATAGTNLPVASNAGFTAGRLMSVELDNGSQLQTHVVSTSAGHILMQDPVPAGRNVPNGAVVNRAPVLNGNAELFQVNFITLPFDEQLVVTNGVDVLMEFDGTSLVPVPGTPFDSCRTITLFHGMLCAADLTESGVRIPYRIRRSNIADETNWITGTAGFDDLTDTEDFILSLNLLGPWLIAYRETSIMRCTFVGAFDQTLFWEYTIQGTGPISMGGVAETGAEHFIISKSGLFNYNGGYDIEDVGGKIFDYLLSAQGIINPEAEGSIFCFYVSELDEVWIFVPTATNTSCDTLIRFDQGLESWFVRQFADNFLGFGFFEQVSSFTWATYPGTWAAATTRWTQRTLSANAPVTLLCNPDDNHVHSYDYITQTDNGVIPQFYVATKDFEISGSFIRTNSVTIRGTGNNINISFSFDQGQTFQALGNVNFGLGSGTMRLDGQYIAESVRVVISGPCPGFSLDWLEIEFREESSW